MNCVIVDDDVIARQNLRSCILAYPDLSIVGEAESLESGIKLINSVKPDIIFLDISFPSGTAFDILDDIDDSFEYEIVFVSSHEAYAVKGFEVNAIDYLVKPVTQERFTVTYDRINKSVVPSNDEKISGKLNYDDVVLLKHGNKSKFVKLTQIICIVANGYCSEINISHDSKIVIVKSLKLWESNLPNKHFVRIHRSTIINLEYVERVEPWFQSSYKIYLKEMKTPFEISRRYSKRIRKSFEV